MSKLSHLQLQQLLMGAKLSEIAYMNCDEGRKALSVLDIEYIFFFSGKTTQVFLGRDPNGSAIIAFRGTEKTSSNDILTDLNFSLMDFHFGKVHSGFYYALEEVFQPLVCVIESNFEKGCNVKIFGHSLGAALSVFMAARLSEEKGFKKIDIINFGQPRLGDRAFISEVSKRFAQRYIRVVNDKDVVPKLPPHHKFKFEHNDDLIFIDENGSINKLTASIVYWLQGIDVLGDFIEGFGSKDENALKEILLDNLKQFGEDHLITNYIKRLSLACDVAQFTGVEASV